jgi:hypothetical protein
MGGGRLAGRHEGWPPTFRSARPLRPPAFFSRPVLDDRFVAGLLVRLAFTGTLIRKPTGPGGLPGLQNRLLPA